MASAAELAILITAKDQASGALRGISGSLRGMASAATRSSQMLAVGLGGIGAAAVGLGVKMIGMAGELEQTKVAFTTLLGSAEKADEMVRDLTKFAAETPFELKGLQDSSRQLLAYGFQAKAIIPMMTAIGNAVSGLGGGEFEIQRVTRALGQMQAKGKVSAQEMMQLAELGIPAWEMLAETIGVDIPTAMKMAEKGAIPAGRAIEGLVAGMNKRFPDMMKKQSETMLGIWSNLKDNLSVTMTTIGTKLIETFDLKGKLKGLVDGLGEAKGAIMDFLDTLQAKGIDAALEAAFGANARTVVYMLAGAITVALIPALVSAAGTLLSVLAPLLPLLAVGAAVGLMLGQMGVSFDDLAGFAHGAWVTLQEVGRVLSNILLPPLRRAWEQISGALAPAFDGLSTKGVDLNQTFKEITEFLAGNLVPIIEALGDIIATVIIPNWQTFAVVAGALLVPLAAVALAIGAVLAIIRLLAEAWNNNWLRMRDFVQWAAGSINWWIRAIVDHWREALNQIIHDTESWTNSVLSGFNQMIEGYNRFKSIFRPWERDAPLFGRVELPRLAHGGTILGGGAAIVGERGPEVLSLPRGATVQPLSGRAGGTVVNLTVQGSVWTTGDLLEELRRGLLLTAARNVTSGIT